MKYEFQTIKNLIERVSLLPEKQLKKWWIYPTIDQTVDQELSAFAPYMRQLLFNRGCDNEQAAIEYLNASLPLGDPFALLDMEKTIDRILLAIDQKESIVVYGDYDVDGVSATALMVQVLKTLGGNVNAYIPNRFEEGYGLNSEAVQELNANGVRLMLTVDCGIRSQREADLARELGIDLIISDHHYPKGDLPAAFAVIVRSGKTIPILIKKWPGVVWRTKLRRGCLQKGHYLGSRLTIGLILLLSELWRTSYH